MAICKQKFGEYNGKEVYAYTIKNKNGLSAEILNYGGIIRKLIYKDVDVVLGWDNFDEYIKNSGYLGALIGRNSNRIENSEFEINGKIYTLFPNDGNNNLHGGQIGFDKKIWDVETLDEEEPSLILSLISPDGEEGFPGTVSVKVKYTLTNDNGLSIHYTGVCDQDTVLNLTNHSYFNLNGHSSGTVDNHLLYVDSSFYTPNNDECLPTGEVLSVKDTPFDFSEEASLGEKINSDYEQIKKFGGFDHNFILNGRGYRKVAECKGDKTGITMEVYTDQTGMQIYSGNGIEEGHQCKDGASYKKHNAVCFETQGFPNSLKFSHFTDVILKKGAVYDTTTTYKFR